jgi:hypothetical protein
MLASFDVSPDGALPGVARQFIARFSPAPSLRNQVQEIIWADDRGPSVPKRFRREFARALDSSDLYADVNKFDALIKSLFEIEDNPFAELVGDQGLRAQIERHVYRNPGDWSPEYLFEQLRAYDCSDRRFCLLLEGLASSDVRLDEKEQRRFVALVNGALGGCDTELRETGSEDFLLLLPHGRRVVIEVDGKQHFTDDHGRASPAKYAEMMAADRDLRLVGYEVYRFGAAELQGGEEAKTAVKNFFEALFKKYGIPTRRDQ